jgi:hypothetical protein
LVGKAQTLLGIVAQADYTAKWFTVEAELTKFDSLIHRNVASTVNGLVDFLGVERERVPGNVLRDAERLECLLLAV